MSGAYAYLLDTNAASALIRGRVTPELQQLLIDHSACISVITEAELRFGAVRRPEATRLATAIAVFLQNTPVLPWTSATAQAYAELRTLMEKAGVNVGHGLADRRPGEGRRLHAGQRRRSFCARTRTAGAGLVRKRRALVPKNEAAKSFKAPRLTGPSLGRGCMWPMHRSCRL